MLSSFVDVLIACTREIIHLALFTMDAFYSPNGLELKMVVVSHVFILVIICARKIAQC